MELHRLTPAPGSVKKRKRIGRGQGSGHGGTSTRGHKGDGSRSGAKEKRNFEGGQMPLQMRLPKIGFKRPNRLVYVPFNLGRLQEVSDKFKLSAITPEVLIEHGIVGKGDKIKVLASGELKAKLSVSAHAVSGAAKEAIEQLGGSVQLV